MDVYRAFETLEIVAEDPVQKFHPGEGPPRFPGQHLQQPELGGSEIHDLASHPDLVATAVYHQVGKAHLRRTMRGLFADPAQHCPHPGYQFAGAEGLGDVVIGAQIQADESIRFGGLGREHDDRHLGLGLQDTADVEPIHLGQQQVQHDQVRPSLAGQLQGFQAVVSDEHPVAVPLQIEPDQVHDLPVVVNHQDLALGHPLVCSSPCLSDSQLVSIIP